MPLKPLPSSASLDHLKNQARDLKKGLQVRDPQAAQRVREFHPKFSAASDDEVFGSPFKLSDAQLTIAREYGLPSWPRLHEFVSSGSGADSRPHHEQIADPLFRHAVDLLDAGDERGLTDLLKMHPELVRQRITFPIRDYFGEPTLLEFVAENPIRRGTMPQNITSIAHAILEAGAKHDRAAISRTLALVSSGAVARKMGAQIPLIDLLCDYGGDPDEALQSAIGQSEFAAAEALIRRGARVDLPTAAALGRLAEFRALLPTADAESRHRALAWAAQYGHIEIVRGLLDGGEDPSRYNPAQAHAHSTPLHQAALAGHLDVVRLLVERGADVTRKDVLFQGTPLGWALHGGQTKVAEYLRGLSRLPRRPTGVVYRK